jgi:hypothetical protein
MPAAIIRRIIESLPCPLGVRNEGKFFRAALLWKGPFKLYQGIGAGPSATGQFSKQSR